MYTKEEKSSTILHILVSKKAHLGMKRCQNSSLYIAIAIIELHLLESTSK